MSRFQPLPALACLLAGLAVAAMPEDADMVRIPAGQFTMGRDDGPDDERPAHAVTLRSYAIDRLPVTNAQFAAFLDRRGPIDRSEGRLFDFDDPDARIEHRAGRWRAMRGYEHHPAIEVTWLGARAYCSWAGKRLPTEAEWEKAARGTDGRKYPWGETPPDAERAHFGAGWNATAPVGTRPAGASPYGALDMAGGAWQWLSTAYRPYPYRADDGREDPVPGPVRGTRGGGHDARAPDLTTTARGRTLSRNPAAGHHNIGFRCVSD